LQLAQARESATLGFLDRFQFQYIALQDVMTGDALKTACPRISPRIFGSVAQIKD
jgi:hypothetical protein